jgi:hypothetical protein
VLATAVVLGTTWSFSHSTPRKRPPQLVQYDSQYAKARSSNAVTLKPLPLKNEPCGPSSVGKTRHSPAGDYIEVCSYR